MNARLLFVPVDECKQFAVPNFSFDPSIPLPVLLYEGDSTADISLEMILLGMLNAVTNNPTGEHNAYYRQFIQTARPSLVAELGEAAFFSAQNGNYDYARDTIKLLTTLFSDSPEFLLYRALVFETIGEDAHWAYSEALAHDKPLPILFFYAGMFFKKHLHFKKAYKCLSHYTHIADNPQKKAQARIVCAEIVQHDLRDSTFDAAYQCLKEHNEQKALELIHIFLKKNPLVWQGWFILGWALRLSGRFLEGREAFTKAIELGSDSIETHNECAICCMELGDFRAAQKELEKALSIDPEDVKVISNFGVLALKRGKRTEAEKFFRIVLELEPKDPVACAFFSEKL
ncbi:hypothetical protein PilKf_01938 [Pillotina sp. SPG140]